MSPENDKRETGEHDEIEQAARETFAGGVPPELENNLRQSLVSFRHDLPGHPYVQRLHKGRPSRLAAPLWLRRVGQPALLAATAAACVVLAAILTLGPATPTWADVAERFASVDFFNATIYFRDDALAAPTYLELWMGRGGRLRLKIGPQVIFATRGRVLKAFDVKQRKEVEPHRLALNMLRVLGDTERFSLDTVVAAFSGGKLKDVTPLVNPDAAMADDLVVFDVQADRTAEWLRIWALKESKLPIRVQIWNPGDGGGGDAVFIYARQQPEAFFDPEAFARKLADRSVSSRTLSYLDLTDPGGKTYVPTPPDYEKALALVTRTLDGKPWSLADHRGKTVLLYVWAPGSQYYLEKQIRRLHAEHGQREDFMVVSIAIGKSAEAVRVAVEKQKIPWTVLHEPGKEWKNSLAQAIGTPYRSCLFVVGRDGSVEVEPYLRQPHGDVMEFELFGLTYDSWRTLLRKIQKAAKSGGMTTEQLRQLCGEPDETDASSPSDPNREEWTYILLDKNKEREKRFSVIVDKKTGRVVGWGGGHRILNPARLKVTITPEYWKNSILPQVDPKHRPQNDPQDRYLVYLVLETVPPGHGYLLGQGDTREDYVPGQTHETRKLHGTYRLLVRVEQREGDKPLQTIVVKEGLTLEKDSETEVVLE